MSERVRKAKFGLDATTGRYLFSRWKHPSVALDAAGIDLGISTEEIIEFVREGREDYKSFEHNVRRNRYDREYLQKLINVW
ncbi:MAG TPA: hypothetical protein VF644_06185 [Pyrinomonadaceae bacterium]|jgi:hypothetical protein